MKSVKTLGLLLFAGLIIFIGLSTRSTSPIPAPSPGRIVSCADISWESGGKGPILECLDGQSSLDVSTVRGPLIINVWGSWCAPCKEEMPILRSFYAKNQSVVEILGVDVEEAKIADGKEFVVAEGMTWPNVIDTDGSSRAYFGMGVPVTWFVDGQGTVVFKKYGAFKDEQELRDLTSRYLKITVG